MQMKTVREVFEILLMFQTGVSFWKQVAAFNCEEAGLFEGDILLPEGKTIQDIRNGLIDTRYRWTNGIVPYTFDARFTADEVSSINRAFEEYHAKTCIRFSPRNNETDYIRLTNLPNGCYSYAGRVGGAQRLNLQSKCIRRVAIILHELCHALGFFHDHSRWDRDDYVIINFENIHPEMVHNFEKVPQNEADSFGVPYDYASLMHYSAASFSINGLATITPKDPFATIGQREGFNGGDLKKINAMYC